MLPALVQQGGELPPDLRLARLAHQHPVVDQPAGLAVPPGPNADLDPVLLHVGPGGQQEPSFGHRAHEPVLAPLVQALPVRAVAGLGPGFAQDRVDEGTMGLVRPTRLLVEGGDPRPAQPAQGRV